MMLSFQSFAVGSVIAWEFSEGNQMRVEVYKSVRMLGTAVAGVLLFVGSQPAARADDMAYMSTGSFQFGTIDLNTGVFTQLGNSGQLLSGLGTIGGNIYGGLFDSDILYQVNLVNGGLTEIGTGSINYNDTGSTTTGLYAVNYGATDLYQVDPLTGATTLIGPTGFAPFSFGVIGMSTGSSTLYFAGGYNLYSLSTTTGEATLIGSQGFAVGALVSEGGALWAGASPLDVYTLNTSTAAGTLVTGVTGGASTFWGLTPDPLTTSVPEPSSVILLATVLLAVAFVARKRIAQGL
jgi:hypothetical protein